MAGGSQLRSLRGFITPRLVAFQLPVGTPRYHRFVLLVSALKFSPSILVGSQRVLDFLFKLTEIYFCIMFLPFIDYSNILCQKQRFTIVEITFTKITRIGKSEINLLT